MKEGVIDVTVLSGSPTRYEEPLFRFAEGLCYSDRIDLILDPFLDVALVDLNHRSISAQKRFQVREIVQARATSSHNRGSEKGIIVSRVAYGPDNKERYEDCIALMRKERVIVKRWGLFRELYSACLIPSGDILLVEE